MRSLFQGPLRRVDHLRVWPPVHWEGIGASQLEGQTRAGIAETYHRSQQSSAQAAHFTSTVYSGAIGASTTGSSGTSTAANRKTGIAAVPVRHPSLRMRYA